MLFLLYLTCAALGILLARWLGQAVSLRTAAILSFLPVVFFLPAFLGLATPLPVDHCASVPPWNFRPHPAARNANMDDVAHQTLPWAKAVRDAWREGVFPWRNRWNGCGMPLSTNGQSAAYAPWTLLSLFLPLAPALVFIGALKLFLALLGSWLWLRQLQLSEEAALFGAISSGLCLSMTLWLFWQQSAVIALWPWSLFLIECQLQEKSRRAWWALVLVLALLPLSGHLESVASGAAFVGLWLLTRTVFESRRLMDAAPRIIAAAAAASGLAAFSLLPQILAILASNRLVLSSPSFWKPQLTPAPHGPRWPEVLLTTIFPRSLGDQIASPLLPGAPASFPELALGYIGSVGWCLVAFFLFSGGLRPRARRDRRALALLVPAVAALGAASLAWPFAEFSGMVPWLRYIFPPRFLSCAAVACAAIAAFGLERLGRGESSDSAPAYRFLIPVAGFAGAALLVFVLLRRRHAAAGGLPSQLHALWLTEAVLLGLCVWIVWCARRSLPNKALFAGITALACAELLFQGSRFYRYGDPRLLYPPTPLIEFLREQPRPFRVLGEGAAFYPNSNVFAGVEEIRVHDPAERRDYVEFLDRTCGYDPRPYFKDIRDLSAPALDFLNVKYLIATPDRAQPAPKWSLVYRGPDGTVFENQRVLPRVFSPRTLVWVKGRPDPTSWHRNAMPEYGSYLSEMTPTSDWRETAYLLGRASTVERNPNVEVLEYQETTNRIELRTVAPSPAIVIASLVQDGGWTARIVSGPRLETFLDNGPFLAIALPGGDHRLVLTYTEPGFLLGASCSALTGGLLAVLAWRGRRRRDPASALP